MQEHYEVIRPRESDIAPVPEYLELIELNSVGLFIGIRLNAQYDNFRVFSLADYLFSI
jgi:hypothetical protein